VDLYLDDEVDGRSGGRQDDRYNAGWNHLDGEAALRFARLRAGSDDLSRIERQSALLSALLAALRARLLTPAVLPRLPDMVDAFWGAVATDIALGDLPALFCLASSMAPEDLRFIELPREMLTSGREYSAQLGGRTSVLYADPEALEALISNFLAGD
jgi:anionic cell wall polymer biosynthesis LytR-Cps2A-Psr (LCP) family protein